MTAGKIEGHLTSHMRDLPKQRSSEVANQAAAGGRHLDVPKTLMDAKADINALAAGTDCRIAVQAVAEVENLELVKMPMDTGLISIHPQRRTGQALWAAATLGLNPNLELL